MDPTEEELRQITNLEEACDWAGCDNFLREALGNALGNPQRVREVALIPRPVCTVASARHGTAAKLPTTSATTATCYQPGRGGPGGIPSKSVQVGAAADDRLHALPPAPVIPGPPFPPLGGAPGGGVGAARKAILGPTMDVEVVPMEEGEIAQCYEQYRQ